MKSFIYLLLLAAAACGAKHTSIDYGKTTVSDLVALKGEPLEERAVPVKGAKVLLFEKNETYQTKNDIVTHGFKNPKGDQKNVIYWKHRFRDCDPIVKQISEVKVHEVPEFEMKCSSQGITVIYSEGSEFVSRVIEHGKE